MISASRITTIAEALPESLLANISLKKRFAITLVLSRPLVRT